MSYFPMFVDLEGKHILAVGAGTVGIRRISVLLKFGALVTAVDPDSRQLEAIEEREGLSWIREPYKTCRKRILEEYPKFFMVLAATGDRDTDLLAVSDGRQMGAFVNAASARSMSDFYFPGIASAGSVTAGLIAGGENHRLARRAAAEVRSFLRDREDAWKREENDKERRSKEENR